MFRSVWFSACPPTCLTPGLDPGGHLFRNRFSAKKMDCRVNDGKGGST